ncbi:MAG: DNA mismatch repair endonuclease MutL [Spirochaetota bacterium]
MPNDSHIQLLEPLVAQRIAAGEVIDRPQAIVRELLDNAIDAGASHIDVAVEQGGIESIRVVDDGSGMSRDDLALCCQSHATSKVATVEDLTQVTTLGFRGEALASMASCAEVTITAADSQGEAHTVTVSDGKQEGPVPGGHARGTTVIVRQLFRTIPGRKKFLKSPQAEAAACKKVFLEKALAFPEIEFRYYSGGKLSLFLPTTGRIQRILDAYQHKFSAVFFQKMEQQGGTFSIEAVASNPSFYRHDRSFIQIFVNNRRIDDYALVQAVTYGYGDYLPGGCFPYCFVFLTVDPELADVNIHPAKREVKLRNEREIHHQLVQLIKQELFEEGRQRQPDVHSHQQPLEFSSQKQSGSTGEKREFVSSPKPNPQWVSKAKQLFGSESADESRPASYEEKREDFYYHGQLFGLFLLVEQAERFYFIDQHAAHERIIYNQLSKQPAKQELLVPLEFEIPREVDDFLREHRDVYLEAGITIIPSEQAELTWQLTAVPQYARSIEDEIVTFIREHAGADEEIAKELFASIACRAAVKDGDMLDSVTAREIADKALNLPVPRCPHGRPIWKEVTRDELFAAVQRTF